MIHSTCTLKVTAQDAFFFIEDKDIEEVSDHYQYCRRHQCQKRCKRSKLNQSSVLFSRSVLSVGIFSPEEMLVIVLAEMPEFSKSRFIRN